MSKKFGQKPLSTGVFYFSFPFQGVNVSPAENGKFFVVSYSDRTGCHEGTVHLSKMVGFLSRHGVRDHASWGHLLESVLSETPGVPSHEARLFLALASKARQV